MLDESNLKVILYTGRRWDWFKFIKQIKESTIIDDRNHIKAKKFYCWNSEIILPATTIKSFSFSSTFYINWCNESIEIEVIFKSKTILYLFCGLFFFRFCGKELCARAGNALYIIILLIFRWSMMFYTNIKQIFNDNECRIY